MQMLIGILVTMPFTTTIFLGGLSSIAGRSLRGSRTRRGDAAAAIPRDHLAAAETIHQHRHRAQHHLRLQFLPDHLGDDAGRAGQLDRHPGHPSLQAGLPHRQARRGLGGVADDVRHPARLHHDLCAAGDAGADAHEERQAEALDHRLAAAGAADRGDALSLRRDVRRPRSSRDRRCCRRPGGRANSAGRISPTCGWRPASARRSPIRSMCR